MSSPPFMENVSSTHLSAAMATRWSIDAVQQRTSHDVHISHSSGPSIQPSLICKYTCKKWNEIFWKCHQSKRKPNKYNSIRLPERSWYSHNKNKIHIESFGNQSRHYIDSTYQKYWIYCDIDLKYAMCVCVRASVLKFKRSRK